MSGKPSSTIAFEKRWNPLLSKSREDSSMHSLTYLTSPRACITSVSREQSDDRGRTLKPR